MDEAKYVGESVRGEFLYTGEKYERLESEALTLFDVLMSKNSQTICSDESVASVLNKYNYLSEEQRSAIVSLTSEANVEILLGKAGAGKTTAMKAVAEIYEQNGARVVGMSLSAVASENLGKDAGIESATIACWSHKWRTYEAAKEKFLSFDSIVTEGVLKQFAWYRDLKMFESCQLKKGDVIILDEAGMTGTADWKNILDFANKFGAKIIAVGDNNQFKPISSGDIFRSVTRDEPPQALVCRVPDDNATAVVSDVGKIALEVVRLNEIRRQKSEWMRDASVEFSKLNTAEALVKYESHGHVHGVDRTYEAIADRYLALESKGSASVLCTTKIECTKINDIIRAMKKDAEILKHDVASVNGRGLSIDDKIIFLKNDKAFGVKNGEVGVVAGFNDGFLSIQTDDGVKHIDIEKYQNIDHAYAITLHKSQGKTYDNAIVLANKIMDAKAFYVGMTRHRESVDLFYSKSDFASFKSLINSASKYIHKDSISDYRDINNVNKSKVFEYKETLLEMSSVLKDINTGEGNWVDYRNLKAHNIALGKEILADINKYDLYLKQMGITQEKLEIAVGNKSRPLSSVELTAKNRVDLYVQASRDVGKIHYDMKEEEFNIKSHKDYGKYLELREIRNDLAKEILANYPLHREFVSAASEAGISKRAMENQVNYEKNSKIQQQNFIQLIEKINAGDYKPTSDITGVLKNEQACPVYKKVVETHLQDHGYGLHITGYMLREYAKSKNIETAFDHAVNRYASMLAQKEIDKTEAKEASLEMLEKAMKTAVCFDALQKNASEKIDATLLDAKSIEDLHQKAHVLSNNLDDKSLQVLNDVAAMKEISGAIKTVDSVDPLPSQNNQQILTLHEMSKIQKDAFRQRDAELQKQQGRGIEF